MSYLALKHLHLTLVGLSAAGFLLRGIWMWRRSTLLRHRLTRILPHLIDTLLLATGVALLVATSGAFLALPWLHAKLTGLLCYIVLGAVALRRGKTLRVRLVAYFSALACLGWMATVAWLKTPWGFFSLLHAQG